MLDRMINKKEENALSRRIIQQLSDVYCATKVFSETSRRPRYIRVLKFKGSEFAILLFSAIPVLFSEIIPTAASRDEMW